MFEFACVLSLSC